MWGICMHTNTQVKIYTNLKDEMGMNLEKKWLKRDDFITIKNSVAAVE